MFDLKLRERTYLKPIANWLGMQASGALWAQRFNGGTQFAFQYRVFRRAIDRIRSEALLFWYWHRLQC